MIGINNLTDFSISKDFFKKIAKKVLERESSFAPAPAKATAGKKASEDKEKKKIDLSIALVNSRRIKELNKKYRRKDKITDVLSFKYNGSGEIVICPEVIKKNAKEYKLTFKKELARVLIHGILHLLGYDHENSKREAKKMEKKENYYLEKI